MATFKQWSDSRGLQGVEARRHPTIGEESAWNAAIDSCIVAAQAKYDKHNPETEGVWLAIEAMKELKSK